MSTTSRTGKTKPIGVDVDNMDTVVDGHDPSFTKFTSEKFRGALSSLISGGVSGALNLGTVSAGLDPTLSAFVFVYIVGNLLGYAMDGLFAKENLYIPWGYVHPDTLEHFRPYFGRVPFRDFLTRAKWLFYSFTRPIFYKFTVSAFIDSLIGLSILWVASDFLDEREILTDFKLRDAFVSGFIAIFTFFLFTNMLRFDWAYNETAPPVMTTVVLMTAAIVIMVFFISIRTSILVGTRKENVKDYAP